MVSNFQNSENPKYLDMTLDRSLTFKEHCKKTKFKVNARNDLIRKLVGLAWGAEPHTVKTTVL